LIARRLGVKSVGRMPAPARAPAPRWSPAVAAGLVVTALVVPLHLTFNRHAGPLWRDEVTGVNLVGLPSFADVLANLHLDSFPYAWVTLLRLWATTAGTDDATLRVLGLLVGLAILPAVWWTGRRLGLDAPLVTLVLVALNPSTIIYGGSVRGYGLGALAVTLALGALWTFVERPGRRTWAAAAAAVLFAVQTYFPNGVLLAAIGAGAAAVCLRRGAWGTLAGVVAAGAVGIVSLAFATPWIRYAFRVGALEQGDWPLALVAGVFRGALATEVPALGVAWTVAAVATAIGWGAALVRRADDTERDPALFAAVTATTALAAYFAYLQLVARLPTQYWYYLSLMAVLALALDVGTWLAAKRLRHGAALRAACALLVVAVAAPSVLRTVRLRMTNVDLVARKVAADGRPEDLAVVVPWVAGITFHRYYAGTTPWITIPDLDDHRFHLHLRVAEKMARGDDGVRDELARVERTLRSGGRVWVAGWLRAPAPGQMPAPLPPAPEGPTGWRAAPYLDAWELRLGALLRTHAVDVWEVPLPGVGAVNHWEALPLVVAEGWR
jgi:hypothetical protein